MASTQANKSVRGAVLIGMAALTALTLFANAARLRELLETFA